eukprot:scaffold873_cov252-Pinguiococcus_pyrenoidosus.AAC.12
MSTTCLRLVYDLSTTCLRLESRRDATRCVASCAHHAGLPRLDDGLCVFVANGLDFRIVREGQGGIPANRRS